MRVRSRNIARPACTRSLPLTAFVGRTRHPGFFESVATMKKKTSSKRSAPRASDLSHAEFMKKLVVALDAVREGDFMTQLPSNWTGLEGKVADSLNIIVTRMQ